MTLFYLRWIAEAALLGVLTVFAYRGLLRDYPAFTMFLAAKGIRSLSLLPLSPDDLLYGKCWAFSAPFLMVLQLLVLLELTSKVVEHYPKIEKRGGRLIITSCLGVGAILGAVSYAFQFGNGRYPWYVPAAIGAYKIFDWLTVGALIFPSVWLALFPERIRKNVQWHRWLLAAYIGLGPGIALMFSTVGNGGGLLRYCVDCGLEVIEISCCVLWMLTLTLAGETFPDVPKTISEEELKRINRDYQDVLSTLREEYPLPEILNED